MRDTCQKPARKQQPFAPVVRLAIFYIKQTNMSIKRPNIVVQLIQNNTEGYSREKASDIPKFCLKQTSTVRLRIYTKIFHVWSERRRNCAKYEKNYCLFIWIIKCSYSTLSQFRPNQIKVLLTIAWGFPFKLPKLQLTLCRIYVTQNAGVLRQNFQ